ncbi:uncharacterized protein SCHCODRAFT_02724542 [Schizophyllum commune H4-8]|uniref:uncharacterized protein n=1 Tax=Schizophyllum commune (strain H4-8 / FGSC 9210) TaxID=578458 RepID=UPI00215F46AD|nr:uncharacterized protein SCHCODRAFT_02724542 [Schizophyllum commune H4-8]KAI5896453.1 hypothetical protein SCHCODRAFT_02724542 [Schizophyllum commune H4-8]
MSSSCTPSSSSPSLDRVNSECPPPRKRLRTVTPGRFLPPDEIEREKAASLARLFESWANLEERYTRDLEDDDIVDLADLTVIKDRGVLASSPVKQFGMRQALLDDGDDEGSENQDEQPGEQEEEAEEVQEPEESDDELDAFAPKPAKDLPPRRQPLTEEEIEEFMRAERERRRSEDDATDFSSEAPYTSDAFSDASRPPDTDDDDSAPLSSDPKVIEIFDSDDELDDWGLESEANIVYLVPKGDESEGELNAPSSPSPAGAQSNALRGRPQQPIPVQLYTPPRSKTASSVPPFDTPGTDERPFIQDSPAYAPPSSPLPPSSPPLSSSPVAPSPIKSRPKLTRPQSSPIRRAQFSPAPTARAENTTDNDRTPAASKLNTMNTPQSTPIPRLDLSKMLSSKRRSKKSLSIFNSPATTPSRQASATEDSSPGRSPECSPTRGSMLPPPRPSPPPVMSAKAKGKQRAVDLFTPTPPLSQDDSSSVHDSSSPVRVPQEVTRPSVTRMPTTSITRLSTTSTQVSTPAQPTVPRAKKRKRQSSAGSAMSVDEQSNASQPSGGSTSTDGAKATSGSSLNKPSDKGKPGKALPARGPTCYVEISVPPPRQGGQTPSHKALKTQPSKQTPATNANTQAHGTHAPAVHSRSRSCHRQRARNRRKLCGHLHPPRPRPRSRDRARSREPGQRPSHDLM